MDRETAIKAFSNFDSDRSGKIDVSELRNVVKAFRELIGESDLGDAQIDADVKLILAEVDTSKDGKIDREEFIRFFTT